MPSLIEEGHVYVAESPLYKVTKGKESVYLLDDNALNEYKKKHGYSNLYVQRFKGLGELSPEQLKDTTMDISKRRIRQIVIEDKPAIALMFNRLMGTAVAPRREFIEDNAYKIEVAI
jgi:DNA gyrase subunit B